MKSFSFFFNAQLKFLYKLVNKIRNTVLSVLSCAWSCTCWLFAIQISSLIKEESSKQKFLDAELTVSSI